MVEKIRPVAKRIGMNWMTPEATSALQG